jgi:Zn-dependent protease with chaperone function
MPAVSGRLSGDTIDANSTTKRGKAMRALAPPDVALIRKLEQQARDNPAAYRSKVSLLSWVGNLTLTLIRILPIALPIVVILMMFSHPLIQVIAVLTLLLFLWTMRPNHEETGQPLTRGAAPALYAAVDELRTKLNVPREMNIVLTRHFNAGALEMPGLLGSFGIRRTLDLGVPMLAAFTRDELLAVIGHELGHFSHRHGPMGHRIYRARYGWLAYARHVDESDSALDRAAAAFARMFVPYFNSYSFIYGRQCEYEADADAASAAGADKVAHALARSAITGDMWMDDFELQLGKLQRELPVPPDDLIERFIACTRGIGPEELARRLQAALALPSDWMDTHPCLAERIAALKQAPVLPPATGPCAGEALLGAFWQDITREYNRKWVAEIASTWALEHARQHHLAALLALPPNDPALRGWPLEQRLARADLLASHSPQQAIEELRTVLEDHPGHPGTSFALGAMTLHDAPASAAPLLEHAAKQDHGFRVPAYLRMEAHCRRTGDAQGAYNYARRLELAREKRGHALYLFAREIDLGQFLPSTLPAGSAALLREARKADPCVMGGWLLSRDPAAPPPPPDPSGGKVPDGTWFGGHAIILTVDPDRMQAAGLTEDQVADRYTFCLRSLGAPNLMSWTRVLYSSEAFAPELQRALDALPPDCVF